MLTVLVSLFEFCEKLLFHASVERCERHVEEYSQANSLNTYAKKNGISPQKPVSYSLSFQNPL